MKLLKQIVIKKLENFYENRENNIYFYIDFFSVYGLCLVYMNRNYGYEIDYKFIEKLNKRWLKTNTWAMKEALKTSDDPKIIRDNYIKFRTKYINLIRKSSESLKVMNVINNFIEKTKSLVETDDQVEFSLNIEKRGRITIDSSYYNG